MACPSNPHPITASARVKFDCYPRLKLSPEVLGLGVGADRKVTVKGTHPLTGDVEYWTDHPAVATVGRASVRA